MLNWEVRVGEVVGFGMVALSVDESDWVPSLTPTGPPFGVERSVSCETLLADFRIQALARRGVSRLGRLDTYSTVHSFRSLAQWLCSALQTLGRTQRHHAKGSADGTSPNFDGQVFALR
ncbi:hypothetical protein LNV23_12460 [Paucibacter sp. DJ1R-11]|uniref:hypothetical protein n=1 Tax=Paucibacter sp. DJ1R-11 TaxID=2893556 RepID=UPI0021E3E2D8|nr:hypothetical protein [Paucibacter sp. DJ1R-11]MCV2364257.1 hypothetical protein [Paucibacter sp. DJ1R-11]